MPDHSELLRAEGIAAARSGDLPKARAALEQAVQVNPRDEEAWFGLAMLQTNPWWALAALERLLALNPQHTRARAAHAAVRAHLKLNTPAAPATVAVPAGVAEGNGAAHS